MGAAQTVGEPRAYSARIPGVLVWGSGDIGGAAASVVDLERIMEEDVRQNHAKLAQSSNRRRGYY